MGISPFKLLARLSHYFDLLVHDGEYNVDELIVIGVFKKELILILSVGKLRVA